MAEEIIPDLEIPRNAAEAKQIATHGDSVVSILSDSRNLDVQSAAACVNALIRIGTDSALEAIKEISRRDSRTRVWKELYRGITSWPDTEGYISALFPCPLHIGLGPRETYIATSRSDLLVPTHFPPPGRLTFSQALVLIRSEIVCECTARALTPKQDERVREAGWDYKNHINDEESPFHRRFMVRTAR